MASRAQIIDKVLAKLDEITVFDEAQEVPTVSLVDKLLDESTIGMLRHAPLHMLSPVKINTESIEDDIHFKITDVPVGNEYGYFLLPEDFLRLFSFKMVSWRRPVTEAITEQDKRYLDQFNPFTMGGVVKPVVVITRGDVFEGEELDPGVIIPPAED